jgi:predicted acylesterase/phospholipase RssA
VAALADRLGRALPVGIFDNDPVRRFLADMFTVEGRTDDFRKLKNELYVVATDLDSGEAVRFGEGADADVPISRAIQASTALPGLYPPVEIDGRFYVDGVLLKTVHASVALDRGARLVICVNPIVPVDTAQAAAQGVMRRGKLIDRGMPTVMSQTLRTLVHSRLAVGLRAYDDAYEGADVLLFEPSRDDYAMFFTNIFTFSARKQVVEHAYRSTLRNLAARREKVRPILERHGLSLDDAVLDNPDRDLWANVRLDRAKRIGRATPLARRLFTALDRLEGALEGAS